MFSASKTMPSSKTLNSFIEAIQLLAITSNIASAPQSLLFGTHDGSFHCDEALALSLLTLHPSFQMGNDKSMKFQIIRTRNPEYLKQCYLICDVGAQYDPAHYRFDHHQREFTDFFNTGYSVTKLSSAGLIYKHYGKEILSNILSMESNNNDSHSSTPSSNVVDILYEKVYKDFIEHIDAIDNGVSICANPSDEEKYHISTSLSSRIGRLNPYWNDPDSNNSDAINERFKQAMLIAGSEFIDYVVGLHLSWLPARQIVETALQERTQEATEGELRKVIILPIACPWKDHLFSLESSSKVEEQIIYVIYPDSGGSWRIQAVPVSPNSFESRRKLPKQWCGLRDAQLSSVVGIDGCIFVHANGFIGGHHTKDGAIHMAKQALKL